MKNILLIITAILTFISCKAQQPIIPLFNGSDYLDTSNAYYKDVDGDFTKLIGTWQYTNGSEVFKITLKKKEQDLYNETNEISYYEDVMYGEYQYIDSNGIEIINSISNIDSFTDVSEHFIYGGYIIDNNNLPICDDCSDNERRVKVLIEDPLRPYLSYKMIIRHIPGEVLLGTTEQIKIKIKRSTTAIVPEGQPDNDRIDFDEITLDKQ
ncbi:DUF6705 family protein [Lacinutrix mariniflava]|uniref:DUF6705 family protein n=1 Tax=Lacinutrix mariniflava TaxID=342955 RepID=UPI0006E21393|nr:DUF6705 family protein [Lacinutrix mariniflava]